MALAVGIDARSTPVGRDAVVSVRRGDIDGMSIGFFDVRDEWDIPDDPEKPAKRTVLSARLVDVSITPMPAYPDTDVAVRSLTAALSAKRFDPRLLELRRLRARLQIEVAARRSMC